MSLLPYIDIFKHVKLDTWRRSDKSGEVSSSMDKTIGRKVFRVWGSVPAANFIQVPKARSQTLAMKGRYLYVEFRAILQRFFALHFDVTTEDGLTIRISLSNLFKQFRSSSHAVQIPFTDVTAKWTVLKLDLEAVLERFTTRHYASLRGLQVCASLYIRNVYLSDQQFDSETLPRDMAFPVPKGRQWDERYVFVSFPEREADDQIKLTAVAEVPKPRPASKHVQRENRDDMVHYEPPPRVPLQPLPANEATRTKPAAKPRKKPLRVVGHSDGVERPPLDQRGSPFEQSSSGPANSLVLRSQLPSGPSVQELQGTAMTGTNNAITEGLLAAILPSAPNPPSALRNATLRPDPVMSLSRVIGFSGKRSSNLMWTADAREMVYSSESVIVIMPTAGRSSRNSRPGRSTQRCLIGHTAPISCLAFAQDRSLLASSQFGPEPLVRLWDVASGECWAVLRMHHSDLTQIAWSSDGKYLCGVGKEEHGRTLVVMWDTSNVANRRSGECPVVCKSISDPDIRRIRFLPSATSAVNVRMVSCGKRNIRFWRLKGGSLRGCPVTLGEHSEHEFVDLDYEQGIVNDDPQGGRVFACTTSGCVFQVDSNTLALEAAFQLHNGAINSISVVEGFCVTGSEDQFLRVWPLDFSDYFLEMEYEAAVTSADISYDCLHVLCGTSDGTIGKLSIADYGYDILVRSHNGPLVAVAMRVGAPEITTVSTDGTIRVWNLETFDQMFEFDTPDDRARCALYHPTEWTLVCGFDSGCIRVFDVESTQMTEEYVQHDGPVVSVAFSIDGRYLYSGSSDGIVTMYDEAQRYHPIRILSCAAKGRDLQLAMSSQGKLAFAGPGPATVSIAGADYLAIESTFDTFSSGVCCLAFSPDGEHLLVATDDLRIQKFDVSSGALLDEMMDVHRGPVNSLSVSPDGRYILTGSTDRLVKVWDFAMEDVPEYHAFVGHSGAVSTVECDASQKWVVSVGADNAILVWDFQGDPLPLGEQSSHSVGEDVDGEDVSQVDTSPVDVSVAPSLHEDMDHTTGGFQTSWAMDMSYRSGVMERPEAAVDVLPSKHYRPTRPSAPIAAERFVADDADAAIALSAHCGVSPGHGNVLWLPAKGCIVYSSGCTVVVEHVVSSEQTFFRTHTQEVSALAVSSDSRLVAAAAGTPGREGAAAIVVWDIYSGEVVSALAYHERGVQALAFSPDSKYLASIGTYEECSLAVWDLSTSSLAAATNTNTPMHDLTWFHGPQSSGEFATVGMGTVQFYLLDKDDEDDDGEPRTRLSYCPAAMASDEAHVDYTCIAYWKEIVYVGDSNGRVVVWDAASNEQMGGWQADDGELGVLFCVANTLITGGSSGVLRSWAIGTDRTAALGVLAEQMELDGPIRSITFEEEGKDGIISTACGTMWHVNWVEGDATQLCSSHIGRVNHVTIDASGVFASTAGADGSVRVWALNTPIPKQLMQFQVANTAATCVRFLPSRGGKTSAVTLEVAAGYSDGTVRIFDVTTIKMARKMKPSNSAITSITCAHRGRVLLCGSAVGSVTLLSSVHGGLLSEIADHTSAVECIAVSPLNPSLWLACSRDRRVSVWNYEWARDEGELVDWLSFAAPSSPPRDYVDASLPPSLAAWSPVEHNVLLYTGYAMERMVVFYDIDQKVSLRSIPLNQWATSLQVSPDGAFFCTSTADRLLKVIDYATGSFQDYSAHSSEVSCVAFSSAGNVILSAAHGEVCVWGVVE